MIEKSPARIDVAIVEDNRGLRRSLRDILNRTDGLRCVADYGTGEEALKGLTAVRPAVVIMDINLPGMSGVDCVRILVERLPSVLILMLTIQSNIGAVFESLRAGACGYLCKPLRARELVAAVRDVIAGGSPMTAEIARQVVRTFKETPPPAAVSKPLPDLSERERQVLEMLAEGFLYKEIAETMELSWNTVNTYTRRIYEKLHVRSRAQAVAKFRAG